MTLDEQIAILQALKEGKKIEAKLREDNPRFQWEPWKAGHKLNFAAYDYRIVPEPRRWIIHKYGNGPTLYVVPYGCELPAAATIICLATEDPNLGECVQPYLDALKQNLARP